MLRLVDEIKLHRRSRDPAGRESVPRLEIPRVARFRAIPRVSFGQATERGRCQRPSRTQKMLAAVHSAASPRSLSSTTSWSPASCASSSATRRCWPGSHLYPGQRRRRVAAVLAHCQAHRLAMCGSAEQIISPTVGNARRCAIGVVVDDVDSHATFHYVVRAQNLIHLLADHHFDKRERATRALGIASQSLPVAFEGEGHSLEHAQSAEQAPSRSSIPPDLVRSTALRR